MNETQIRGWRRRTGMGMLILVTYLCPWSAKAATLTWTNTASGEFHDAVNWSVGGPPAGTDTAQFNKNAEYTVQFTNNVANTNLLVYDGTVLFDMGGKTYSLKRDDPQPILIRGTGAQNPVLTVSNGTVTADSGGSQSYLSIANALNYRGTLRLIGGGRVTHNRGAVGNGASGNATVLVDGNGSRWTANSTVGINGNSSLIVTNEGYAYFYNMEACGQSGSHFSFLVTGANSYMYARSFNFGMRGTAIGRIENGARVRTWQPIIGQNYDYAVGTVTVTGANSKFQWERYLPARFYVGNSSSSGTLIVENGALVEGVSTLGTAITIYGPSGVLRGGGGTVQTTSGGSGDGEVRNQGLVAPGGTNTAGTLTLLGHYTQTSGGTLQIKIAGTTTNDYDRLIVQGNDDGHCDVTLAGKLEIVFPGGTLYGGDFDVLTTEGTITGADTLSVVFDEVELPGGLPSDYSWEIAVVAEDGLEKLRFTVTPPPRGTVISIQ